jgi:hypothetical protein
LTSGILYGIIKKYEKMLHYEQVTVSPIAIIDAPAAVAAGSSLTSGEGEAPE